MSEENKAVLLKANACVAQGDYEGFLSFCTDDLSYDFVGDKTLQGKEAVRAYMKAQYVEPPMFTVDNLIAEGSMLRRLATSV